MEAFIGTPEEYFGAITLRCEECRNDYDTYDHAHADGRYWRHICNECLTDIAQEEQPELMREIHGL